MDRIRDAVAWMIGAPLHKPQVSLELPPDQRNIVLIDSNAMKKVSKRILGCQTCSPFAEIPVSSILAGFHQSSGPDTYFMLEKMPKCPRCSRAVTEGTLVEVEAEP